MLVRALLTLLVCLQLALSAAAQTHIPLQGGQNAPVCTVAQLAAGTGPCASLGTPEGGDIAVVTDANLETCVTGGGATRVPCAWNEVLAMWIPLWGLTNPASTNLDFQTIGSIVDALSIDFGTNICAGRTNGVLSTNSFGNVVCNEDVAGVGTGHVVVDESTTLTQRANLTLTGTGVTCTDGGAGPGTICNIPGMTVPIVNGSNFVGSVSCPGGVPASGTAPNCEAIVTQLNGNVLNGGYLKLAGTYNATTPHVLYTGFQLVEAVFLPTCNGSSLECGDDFTAFADALNTIADTYNPWTASPGKPKIRFLGYAYNNDPRAPFRLKGAKWTVDVSAGPSFDVVGTASNSLTTITGTATITIGTDANRLVCASCGFCVTGTCHNGDELLRPGDAFRLTSAGDWNALGARVYYVTEIEDDDNIEFTPPALADYSGSIEGATGKVWDFDNVGTDGNLRDTTGGVEMIGAENAVVSCAGACLPANPYTTPQREGGNAICRALDSPFDCCTGAGTGTCASGYRTVPLAGVVTRMQPSSIGFDVKGFGGIWDRAVAFTLRNNADWSSVHGEFVGGVSNDSASPFNGLLARAGLDPNDPNDDGRNTAFLLMAPNLDIKPKSSGGAGIYVYAAGGNCGNIRVDARLMENTGQLFYAPVGCQNIYFDGVSQEQAMFCGGGGQPPCEAAGTEHPFIEIGPWWWPDQYAPAYYRFEGNGMFFSATRTPTFLKITDDQQARVDVEMLVNGASPLWDVTGATIEIAGHVRCIRPDPEFPDCDPPDEGHLNDYQQTDRIGNVTFDGRAISNLQGQLLLAQITDTGTADLCLLGGGGGGDPHWDTCPGGGTTALAGLTTDVVIASPLDEQALIYNIATGKWENTFQNVTAVPFVGAFATDATLNWLVGGTDLSGSDHIFGVDGSVVLNEQGSAVNFRVESDTKANALCVDGTNNRIGIGFGASCTPAGALDVALGVGLPAWFDGLELRESDTNPTCAAGNFGIYADLSELKIKKCNDGVVTDLDTIGGAVNSFATWDVPAGTDPVADAGSDTIAITETGSVVTITGDSATDSIDFDFAAAIDDLADGTLSGSAVEAAGAATQGAVTTGAQTFAGAKTFNGGIILPAGQTIAIGSGCTVGTTIVCVGNSTSGGFITLPEDTDFGAHTWSIDLAATNLAASYSITPGTDGRLNGSSLITADTIGPGQIDETATYTWSVDEFPFLAAGCDGASAGAALDLPTSASPTPACYGTTAARLGALDYADGATADAYAHFTPPANWNTTLALDVDLIYSRFGAEGSNAVRWGVRISCQSTGDSLNAPTWESASESNNTVPAQYGTAKVTFSGLAKTACAAGETVLVDVYREGGDGGDTFTGVASLLELNVRLRRTN